MSCTEKSVTCAHPGGSHAMVYSDWGPADADRTILCVHGLTRNGRDFDRVAAALADAGFRVLAPDIVGRGRSDRLGPDASYETPQYIADILAMLAAEGVTSVDWIGTSMGGLIGMAMASLPQHPIRRMLINDVGPFLPQQALQRIGDYVGVAWRFDDRAAAEEHIRRAYAPFGLKTEADWAFLADISLHRDADGAWTNNYDLRIAEPFQDDQVGDVDLWSLWDELTLPILVLRGAESDLLSTETAYAMTQRGPRATLIDIPGCGHAPALMDEEQISLVLEWAEAGD